MSYIDDFEASKLRLDKSMELIEYLREQMEQKTDEAQKDLLNMEIHQIYHVAQLAHIERLVQLIPNQNLTREFKVKLTMEIETALNNVHTAGKWLYDELYKKWQKGV